MAENSGIAWTDHTFNPVRGCVEVSPGCDHCYAAAMSKRNPAVLGVWGLNGTRIIASEAMWQAVVKWNARAAAVGGRQRVFCASLADVFEAWQGIMSLPAGKGKLARAYKCVNGEFGWDCADDTPEDEYATYQDVRDRLFILIEATPNLDWQLLTKRPQNVMRMVPAAWQKKFPANVWMGTTVEDQQRADERIPELLKIPAAVRFLSVEPMLGEVDPTFGWQEEEHGFTVDWIITGGESGPGHRALDLHALDSLAAECTAAGVPLFIKQDSGPMPGHQGRIPAALWARKEFPKLERSVHP